MYRTRTPALSSATLDASDSESTSVEATQGSELPPAPGELHAGLDSVGELVIKLFDSGTTIAAQGPIYAMVVVSVALIAFGITWVG